MFDEDGKLFEGEQNGGFLKCCDIEQSEGDYWEGQKWEMAQVRSGGGLYNGHDFILRRDGRRVYIGDFNFPIRLGFLPTRCSMRSQYNSIRV